MLKVIIYSAVIGIFAFATSVAALSVWRSWQYQHEQADQKKASKESTPQSDQPATVTLSKESPDQAIARYNLWLMIFIGLLAAVGITQIGFLLSADRSTSDAAAAAKESAKIAQAAFVIGNRPWIRGDAVPADMNIDVNDFGLAAAVRLTMKNVGRSPADRVRAKVKALNLQTLLDPEMSKIQREFCDGFKTQPATETTVIFPDEESIPKRYVDSIGPDATAAAKASVASGIFNFSPFLIVCMAYDFKPETFITSFVVHFTDKSSSGIWDVRKEGRRYIEPDQLGINRLPQFDLFE